MKHTKSYHDAITYLVNYWQKYCVLEERHLEWIHLYVRVYLLKKGKMLYMDGEAKKWVFFVCDGLIARVESRDSDKVNIISVAVPGMALMTTSHLYSQTPIEGDIMALRSGTLVIGVSYQVLLDHMDVHIDTLIDVVSNRKKQQLMRLRIVDLEKRALQRYLLFTKYMPELHALLTNKECALLLGLSEDTVYRGKRLWRTS